MPKGVEHMTYNQESGGFSGVNSSLMPKGVEHSMEQTIR